MHKKTILELHDDLINNRVTHKQLFDSSVKHVEKIKQTLNSINSYCPIDNLEDLKIDNYLAGIPYIMKDLVATKNILTTSSSRILEEFVPMYSATIYERLLAKQALMVAKSNLDEYGMGGTNMNSIHGFTRNPYNTQKGTGGSSGGSAALVAAGCVPFAIGTDTGDSVRKPAAYCGIYGFKPTWSVIPRYGVFPYASSCDQVGVFSRCVADIAIVLETLNGADKNDPTSLIHEKENFYQNLETNQKPLKIGYLKELIDSFDNEVVIQQFQETVDYLKSLNHEIVEISINKDLLKCVRGCYHVVVNSEASSNLGNLTGIAFGHRVSKDDTTDSIFATRSFGLSKFTKARLAIGAMSLKKGNREQYFIAAQKIRSLFVDTYADIFKEIDILMAPCANSGAINPETEKAIGNEDAQLIAENHLSLTNLIGAPGITIPTHFYEGLPYAMSFMSKPFNDQMLLNFAKQFEVGLQAGKFKNLQSFYNVYVEEVK